jgi:hypothetical protein
MYLAGGDGVPKNEVTGKQSSQKEEEEEEARIVAFVSVVTSSSILKRNRPLSCCEVTTMKSLQVCRRGGGLDRLQRCDCEILN